MRVRRREHKIPPWVVTFGDMMALLLCFFILLQMFSEIKQDKEYQRVVTAIRDAFGFSGRVGVLPVDDLPLRSIIQQLEELAVKHHRNPNLSQSTTAGMDGPEMRVTRVREGIVFTIGGPTTFEPYSAEVKERVRRELADIVALLAGRRNKVEIRGHAAPKRLPEGSEWRDLDELSYARARAVRDVLVELGLDPNVFRLVVVGDREPVRPRVVDPLDAAENRRVEIILTEALVDDMNVDASFADPDGARAAARRGEESRE